MFQQMPREEKKWTAASALCGVPLFELTGSKRGHESCSMNRPREHVGGLPGKCKKKETTFPAC